ncbi:membrane protein [marine actinobacterium PHSC20C1]|nr:membrane protein [marine actinobacterium PHSC20C1]
MALGLGLTLAASGASAAPNLATVPAVTAASVATEVSIVAPLTVPPGSGGLIDAETLAGYTEPLGLLTRQLDAVAGKSIAVAIDPMILASIRVLGTSAPESARNWLERLSLIDNEIVPLPYANADPTLLTQSGEVDTLSPVSFDFALDEANFAATVDPEPTASPDPMDVGADVVPAYPTTEEILAWDYSIDGFVRPRANTVVASDLGALAESGTSTIVLSSTNVVQGQGTGSVVTIDGMTALISDSTASAAMDEALGSTLDRDVTAAETALSSAVLAAGAAQSASTASVLIMIDHSLELSSARLDTALASLTSSPSISLVPLTTLAANEPSPATVEDMPQSDARLADFARLSSAAKQERTFFSIAADPEALIAQRRLALLDVLGTIPTDDPADWLTEVNGFLVDSRDYRTAVAVVESSNFLLLADNSFLPVSVNNDLNQAVTVYITVDPRTALLAVGDSRVELHIEANSQAKGDIPVQALSNGVVDVEISLTSTTGLAIGSGTVSEINVQAGWETPIVLAFAALIVVIFAAGFVRSIVRRRKPADD